MKQTMLLLLLALCSLATVQAQEPPTFGLQANRPDRHTAPLLCPADISQDADKTLQATTRNGQLRPWRIPATVARMAEEETAMRLDSIVTFNIDGTKKSLEAFTYDETYRNFHHTQASYNPSTNSWDSNAEYDYRLTDDNVLLLISAMPGDTTNYTIYEYDDQDRWIERRTYQKTEENTWIGLQKLELAYDEHDNLTEEILYYFIDGQWQANNRYIAAYDSINRVIMEKNYYWDEGAWRGGRKTEWTWYDGPNPIKNSEEKPFTRSTEYVWDWENNKWQKYNMYTKAYNADGYIIMDKKEFWRADSGERMEYSASIYFLEYDENNLLQKTESYDYINSTVKWVPNYTTHHKWTIDEEGNRIGYSESIAYDVDLLTGEVITKWTSHRYEEGHDANGNIIWKRDWYTRKPGEEWFEEEELKQTFDEESRLTEALLWYWEGRTRVNYERAIYTYDDEGNCTEEIRYKAASTGQTSSSVATRGAFIEEADLEGWEPYEYIVSSYGNGVRLSKLYYDWQNDNWIRKYGLSIEYDFEYTSEKLIALGIFFGPYKIDVEHSLYVDETGNWISEDKVYYWSEVKATGIAQAATEGAKVTFADNVLSVTGGTEVQNLVYDLGGRLVLSGQSHREQLGHLAQGIYVVRSLVDGEAYTLKISIE